MNQRDATPPQRAPLADTAECLRERPLAGQTTESRQSTQRKVQAPLEARNKNAASFDSSLMKIELAKAADMNAALRWIIPQTATG
jgi:hypothetical protein